MQPNLVNIKIMPAITVDATTFALFGALGDLALRKLFPALYQLDRAGLLNSDTRILALSRDKGEPATHLERIDQALRRYVPAAALSGASGLSDHGLPQRG